MGRLLFLFSQEETIRSYFKISIFMHYFVSVFLKMKVALISLGKYFLQFFSHGVKRYGFMMSAMTS